MRNIIIGLVALAVALAFFGCGEDETPPPSPPSITAPEVTPIPYDDSIKVVWTQSPEHNEEGFAGYYLYVSKNVRFEDMDEAELGTHLVFTSPTSDTEYLMTDYFGDTLEDGAIYYFGVRAVRTTESGDTVSPVEVVETSPVMLGGGRIYFIGSDTVCGFNFEHNIALTVDQTDPEPDMVLDTSTTSESGLEIKSPHLAGTVWTGVSQFKILGVGNIDDFPETDDTDWDEQVDVSSTRVTVVKTAQNHYVKLKITSFGTDEEGRYYINFSYKYQTKTNYPHF